VLLLAPYAVAAPLTFTVDSNGDEVDQTIDGTCATAGNVCTLRAAIQEANANFPDSDTINFAPGVTGQILLTSELPPITGDVTITGPGAAHLAVDGANAYRVLDVQATTSISGLTIRHGLAPVSDDHTFTNAGGISASNDMTLDRVVVTENRATVNGPANNIVQARGGGIVSGGGTVTLTRSTVANNHATSSSSGAGQAFSQGGGIYLYNGGTLHVNHSTISGNDATATINGGSGTSFSTAGGAGIYTGGALTLDQSTISANRATATGATASAVSDYASGGGVYQDNESSLSATGTTVSKNSLFASGADPATQGANLVLLVGGTFRNTIVADPIGGSNCVGTFTSKGYNLEEDPDHRCGFTHPTDIAGKDPMLGPLADNGGPTRTRKLPSGSPAIDQGKSFGATTDQRGAGFPRISNSPTVANAPGGDGADIGAFERNSTAPNKPAILNSNPASPANDNHPKLRGLAQAGSVVKIYKTANCQGAPLVTGSAATFRSPGLPVSIADNTSTTLRATATNSLHNTSLCSAGFTYVEDSRAPNTTIDSFTPHPRYHQATFAFHSSQAGSTFRCRVDSQPYTACNSPKTFSGLAAGPHTFSVRSIDKAGNVDPTPATKSFVL
jgi:hypothetical protein